MDNVDDIIERLSIATARSGYSYAELEKRSGISKSALQRYATGKTKKIPLNVITSLAPILGVSPAYLMGWEENNESFTKDEDANIKYLKSHGKENLVELYKKVKEDGSLLLLTDRNAQLKPEDVAQILQIIDEL